MQLCRYDLAHARLMGGIQQYELILHHSGAAISICQFLTLSKGQSVSLHGTHLRYNVALHRHPSRPNGCLPHDHV
jgi:hypothetical protein